MGKVAMSGYRAWEMDRGTSRGESIHVRADYLLFCWRKGMQNRNVVNINLNSDHLIYLFTRN